MERSLPQIDTAGLDEAGKLAVEAARRFIVHLARGDRPTMGLEPEGYTRHKRRSAIFLGSLLKDGPIASTPQELLVQTGLPEIEAAKLLGDYSIDNT